MRGEKTRGDERKTWPLLLLTRGGWWCNRCLFSCPFDRPYQPSCFCCYHHSVSHSSIHLLNNERTNERSNNRGQAQILKTYFKLYLSLRMKERRGDEMRRPCINWGEKKDHKLSFLMENILEHNKFHGQSPTRGDEDILFCRILVEEGREKKKKKKNHCQWPYCCI